MRLPRKPKDAVQSPYETLGFKDLPFAQEPVVNPYSPDPRRNGAIYAKEPVRAEIEKFERLLVRPKDFTNRARLAYLWSKGDQERGRGMGKTALLRYFRQRINHDWGGSEFDGQFSAAVVYVSFPSQIDRRHMEQLALSALVDICANGVLDVSRATLRLEALAQTDEALAQSAIDEIEGSDPDQNPDKMLDEILQNSGAQPDSFNDIVAERLKDAGVQPAVAIAFSQGAFEDYLKSYRKDGQLKPFYVPHDTKILDVACTLLFNDMVNYLRAANFEGGYLFIDDIENLVDQMTRKQKIEFAKEFGLCTVRPGYANTAHSFFSSVLTTHQQASVGLAQAWADAGLSAVARLDPTSPNSVELPSPSEDQARQIIVAHLDHYRLDPGNDGTIQPFTEDGINALLKNRQNPRHLLTNAAKVVQHAMQEGATSINEATVNAAMDAPAPLVGSDITEGIEGAL